MFFLKIVRFFAVALLVSFVVSCGSSSINKDLSKHKEFIELSKSNNEIIVSMDTVFYKGIPHSILKEEGISFAPFYNFYSLKGEKCIEVLPYSADGKATSHHEYRFFGTNTGMKAYTDFSFSTIGVCKNVIFNNLMNADGLNSLDVGNFTNIGKRPPKFDPGKLKVKREMSKVIKIDQGNKNIYQGDVLIGKFTQGSEKSSDLKESKTVVNITFINLTKCAQIKFEEYKVSRLSNPNMTIETEFEGKYHQLKVKEENASFDSDVIKQAVEYLVTNGYL